MKVVAGVLAAFALSLFSAPQTLNEPPEVPFLVPPAKVETIVYQPPFGNPEITEFSNANVNEGGDAEVYVKIHNKGPRADSFRAYLTGPGFGILLEAGSVPIEPCSEEVISWLITGGQVDADTIFTIRVGVQASGSGKTDHATATLLVRDVPEEREMKPETPWALIVGGVAIALAIGAVILVVITSTKGKLSTQKN